MSVKLKVRIHDRTQVEVYLTYELTNRNVGADRAPIQLNYYLFTPKHLNITQQITKKRFHEVFRNHMRLGTPDYLFCQNCDLQSTQQYLQLGIKMSEKQARQEAVIHEAQFFTNYMDHLLKNHAKEEMWEDEQLKSGEDIYQLLTRYRETYVHPMMQQAQFCATEVVNAFRYSDEYLSNRILSIGFKANIPGYEQFKEKELTYRKEYFPQMDGLGNEEDEEMKLQRLSSLKRYVFQNLFLQLKELKTDIIYKNIFASIAAAFAAIFANLTRVDQFQGAADYGVKFYVLFIIAVLAYVFKDRIKDLSKDYFSTWSKDRIADRELEILFQAPPENLQKKIYSLGRIKEFLHINSTLPDQIRYFKEIIDEKSQAIETDYEVSEYRKSLVINDHLLADLKLKKAHFKDIFRINTHDFLPKMGEPIKQLTITDDDGQAQEIAVAKNYYFDLIIQLNESKTKKLSQERLEAIRIVINKLGIVRLEKLIPDSSFIYEVRT